MILNSLNQKTIWNETAIAYEKHIAKYSTHSHITRLLLGMVTVKPLYIIDFGCGPGNSTYLLSKAFKDAKSILGIDYSELMIEIANKKYSDSSISYIINNEELSIKKDNKYDLVILSNSFFHIVNKHQFLTNIRNLISASGEIHFSMYESVYKDVDWIDNINNMHDRLFDDIKNAVSIFGYEYKDRKENREVYSSETIKDLFFEHGFHVEQSGFIDLNRLPDERLSFFKLPAVINEVFPDISIDIMNNVLNTLNPSLYDVVKRRVYAFKATPITI